MPGCVDEKAIVLHRKPQSRSLQSLEARARQSMGRATEITDMGCCCAIHRGSAKTINFHLSVGGAGNVPVMNSNFIIPLKLCVPAQPPMADAPVLRWTAIDEGSASATR